MSCDAVALLASLWLAAAPAASAAPASPPASVAQEPMFAEIAARAGALKAEVDAFHGQAAPVTADFKRRIEQLAAMDMQAHRTLAERNLDSDLKCILRGIAEDLPLKLHALESATDQAARDAAARDMAYLLNDNVEVITAPPQAPV